ncbi:UNVERIFIED_CONTAM: hypothetical protein FKN15_053012 [Acipenser sinensis]
MSPLKKRTCKSTHSHDRREKDVPAKTVTAIAEIPNRTAQQTPAQDNVDRASDHRPTDMIGQGFQQSSNQNSQNHQDHFSDNGDRLALGDSGRHRELLEFIIEGVQNPYITDLECEKPIHILIHCGEQVAQLG